MYKIKYCAFISYSLCFTYKDDYIYIYIYRYYYALILFLFGLNAGNLYE